MIAKFKREFVALLLLRKCHKTQIDVDFFLLRHLNIVSCMNSLLRKTVASTVPSEDCLSNYSKQRKRVQHNPPVTHVFSNGQTPSIWNVRAILKRWSCLSELNCRSLHSSRFLSSNLLFILLIPLDSCKHQQ